MSERTARITHAPLTRTQDRPAMSRTPPSRRRAAVRTLRPRRRTQPLRQRPSTRLRLRQRNESHEGNCHSRRTEAYWIVLRVREGVQPRSGGLHDVAVIAMAIRGVGGWHLGRAGPVGRARRAGPGWSRTASGPLSSRIRRRSAPHSPRRSEHELPGGSSDAARAPVRLAVATRPASPSAPRLGQDGAHETTTPRPQGRWPPATSQRGTRA